VATLQTKIVQAPASCQRDRYLAAANDRIPCASSSLHVCNNAGNIMGRPRIADRIVKYNVQPDRALFLKKEKQGADAICDLCSET
jgi:hypothetical protein